MRPSAAVPKTTLACAPSAPLPLEPLWFELVVGAAGFEFVAVTTTVVPAPLVVLELACALATDEADEAEGEAEEEVEDEVEDAVDDETEDEAEAEADVELELLAIALELAELEVLPLVR